jgi:hypothetical protein
MISSENDWQPLTIMVTRIEAKRRTKIPTAVFMRKSALVSDFLRRFKFIPLLF